MMFPWEVFAEKDDDGRIRGDRILPWVPIENSTTDIIMFADYSYLLPGGFRLSDMQVIYAYIRYNFDEEAAAKRLGTTKYVLRNRLKRMNLTVQFIADYFDIKEV